MGAHLITHDVHHRLDHRLNTHRDDARSQHRERVLVKKCLVFERNTPII
jgi:hypothetical protein